ncbi:MBL fold metallo-hydrolase [Spongiimicrobium salis]|uniref:MBL fold metallo-hydrolase n=1 Tax=Spongiimicrobium salis TaxID=1667022 RepID=UPI00374D55E5
MKIPSKLKRILKIMLITVLSVIGLIVIVTLLFVNLSPEFGGTATKAQKMSYQKSTNYKEGKFVNKNPVQLDMSARDMGKTLLEFFRPQKSTTPKEDIAVKKIDSAAFSQYQGATRLVWFGHSTFLLQMNQKTILIDPMFGKVPAPHPYLGANRFSKELPLEVEKIPKVDAVVLSHDHYDHLDYGSIRKLKNKVAFFYTPLGVGVHLEAWGIERERIIELDWWQEISLEDLTFICTPAQHFSGRGLNDRANTLWSSWVIKSEEERIFFSGDSGYAEHFKEIGDAYGPFDLAMMECGQYNEKWSDIHMFPEETAQAGIDVRAKKILPIHWGAFKLAMHSWTDPIERVSKKAKALNLPLIAPRIGEVVLLDSKQAQNTKWWD